ncbi:hypothetical protein FA95DRAFT_1564331 [Auriscalpium vulgare]|uniref:Uncharacterized protein n=1 Tax=Auriscalpium vulgare TaxID=40419 RepID=A0ACB8REX5_9AGAM|nr:hypothetical protein FA95DRAFT_1564331 [Auriscalpium vulgare]
MPFTFSNDRPHNVNLQRMPTINRTEWPYSAARSTKTESVPFLIALLAAGTIDEISDIDDGAAIERYIEAQGAADESGRTTSGVTFWLYPKGLRGPYHITDEGEIEQHGTLFTVEPGVLVAEAVEKAKGALTVDGIAHEHIEDGA